MKNGIFLAALMILTFSVAQAQIKPDVEKIKANTRIKQAPSKTAPPPPPAPVNKTTTSTETLVYTLTSVRVKIRTGSDNKEFPSNVSVSVRTKNTRDGIGVPFSQFSLSNEMRINSETEFGLERHTQYQVASDLGTFQSEGLRLVLRYRPNFFADAWKIENLSLVLEFKDQHGNLHPTFGSKTILFSNAYGFLNNDYQVLECTTDGNFAPLTAVIKK